jgi:hypothetical protein
MLIALSYESVWLHNLHYIDVFLKIVIKKKKKSICREYYNQSEYEMNKRIQIKLSMAMGKKISL